MELTKEQIEFLDKVCVGKWTLNENGEVDVDGSVDMLSYMGFVEIPVKFGNVSGNFNCTSNNLTTLKNCPNYISGVAFYCSGNNLTEYFKSIKEEDFHHWGKLRWGWILKDYPFLINICKNYVFNNEHLKFYLNTVPLTKLYLE